MNWQCDLELLTPCFCRGAYRDQPELRPASIRGMVRWWFRKLGGSAMEEKAAFGGVHNGAVASRLVFRVLPHGLVQARPDPPTLPHKQGRQASPAAAWAAGGTLRVIVTSRLEPLPGELTRKVENALVVWTLLGALGLRANRAGGSLWPVGKTAPEHGAALRECLNAHGCRWPVYLAGPEVGGSPEALRAAATDTVPVPREVFGSARPRQASALKFKVVRLDGAMHLLITAPDERVIKIAQDQLKGHRSKPETWQRL